MNIIVNSSCLAQRASEWGVGSLFVTYVFSIFLRTSLSMRGNEELSWCEPVHSIAIFCTTGHFFLTHPVNFILLNGQPLLMTDESVLEPINLNIPFRNPLRLSIFYARWILVHWVKSWSIEHNRFPVFAPHNLYNMPQFLPYNKASFTAFIHEWTNSPTGSLFYYWSNQPEPVNL